MVRVETPLRKKSTALTFGIKGEVVTKPKQLMPEDFKELKQIGKTNIFRDSKRKALPPGKRISKTGKIYWETRKNRSDKIGEKI